MKIGTKSLLFGVHQFIWHPWTIVRAWKLLYQRWPTLDELICIIVHDWGYWGCPNMDGEEGKRHPERGAEIAEAIVSWRHWWLLFRPSVCKYKGAQAFVFTVLHSSSYAKLHKAKPSALYPTDKASILFEPKWFYLLRARLSGELSEYVNNSPVREYGARAWFAWYSLRVEQKVRRWLTEGKP